MKGEKLKEIPKDKRIVLIRTFTNVKDELRKYPVYTLAGEREEWETILCQNKWKVQDEKEKVYLVDPKQVAVTEFWLQEQAHWDYYKKGELLPVTTSLPRYFDNKSFTQSILSDYNLTMPNVSVRYVPFIERIIDGVGELIPPTKPINEILQKSVLSQVLYHFNTTVRDINVPNVKTRLYHGAKNNSTLIDPADYPLIEAKEESAKFLDFFYRNADLGKASYLKPVLHTGCGMGVVKIGIKEKKFFIQTSDDRLQKLLKKHGGKPDSKNEKILYFVPKKKETHKQMVKRVLLKTYFPYFHKVLGGETNFLLEEEYHLSSMPTKIEFRFVVQEVNGKFKSTANYSKVGDSDFVANLSLSGNPANSMDVLQSILKKIWPYVPDNKIMEVAEKEIKNMEKQSAMIFQTLLDKSKDINTSNKGKKEYLCPSTMNLKFGSVDFTPVYVPQIGIFLLAVEINGGTIGVKRLEEVDAKVYDNVLSMWNKNILAACKIAFGENPPKKS